MKPCESEFSQTLNLCFESYLLALISFYHSLQVNDRHEVFRKETYKSRKLLFIFFLLRTLLMLMAFSIVPFLPSTNIFFTVGFVIAERNLYISSFGFCGLVALGIVVISDFRDFRKVSLKLWTCFGVN